MQPGEIQFAVENDAQTHAGCEATATSYSGNICKSSKPIKANWIKVIQQNALLGQWEHVSECIRMYICSHQYPTCIQERVGACFCSFATEQCAKKWLHVCMRRLWVYRTEGDCIYLAGRQADCSTLRSYQCQAIHSRCEHLVNRLCTLYCPCIFTSIAVDRSLSTSVVNVKSFFVRRNRIGLLNLKMPHWWD